MPKLTHVKRTLTRGEVLHEQIRARLRGWWEAAGRPPQREVGQSCDWDQRSVSVFFAGDGPITIERACLMAHYFGYTMAALVSEMQPPTDRRLVALTHGFQRLDPERQDAVLSLLTALPDSRQRPSAGVRAAGRNAR